LTSSIQNDLILQRQAARIHQAQAGAAGEQFFNNNFIMELAAETKCKRVHETIERCAYLIWEREGRPGGRALENWTQAEAELLAAGRIKFASAEIPAEDGVNSSPSPRRRRYGLVLTQNHAE
jgi:hypothetical protein